MYHTLELAADIRVDLERSPKHRLERIELRRGMTIRAQVRARVIETAHGPSEVTDLYFEDGTVARGIPYDSFTFTEG